MSTPRDRDDWRKSSYSDTGNGCVEVARNLEAVRDSKHPSGPALIIDVRPLIAAVKAGNAER